MRLGLDARALNSPGPSSTRGIGRYIIDLIEGLLEHSPEDRLVLFVMAKRPMPFNWSDRCEIVTVDGPIEYERHIPPGIFPWYMNVPSLRARARRNQFLGEFYGNGLVRKQRAAFEKAVNGAKLDVLHFPTVLDVNSYPEGKFDVPIVATFHDAIPLVYREDYYDTWDRFYRRAFDRRLQLLKTYEKVVAISSASKRDAIQYAQVDPDRIEVVFNSVSARYSIPIESSTARKRYDIPGPFVLFCSPPNPHKNPLRVIEAFAKVFPKLKPDTKLVFISPLDEPDASQLRDFVRLNGLTASNFVITGRIPEEDVIALFQAADCLASPSLLEGFGLPAAQALTAGTPVIVSDRGSQPEVVGAAGLIVDPESVDAISDAILSLMTDKALSLEKIQAGLEQAKLFTFEHQARALRRIYSEVAR